MASIWYSSYSIFSFSQPLFVHLSARYQNYLSWGPESLLNRNFADIFICYPKAELLCKPKWVPKLKNKIFAYNFDQTKSKGIVSKLIKCRYIVRSSLGCQCGWQPQWLSEGRILSKVFAQKKKLKQIFSRGNPQIPGACLLTKRGIHQSLFPENSDWFCKEKMAGFWCNQDA